MYYYEIEPSIEPTPAQLEAVELIQEDVRELEEDICYLLRWNRNADGLRALRQMMLDDLSKYGA